MICSKIASKYLFWSMKQSWGSPRPSNIITLDQENVFGKQKNMTIVSNLLL